MSSNGYDLTFFRRLLLPNDVLRYLLQSYFDDVEKFVLREVCPEWCAALTPFIPTRCWKHNEVFLQATLSAQTQRVLSIVRPTVELYNLRLRDGTPIPSKLFFVAQLETLRCSSSSLPRLVFRRSSFIKTLEVTDAFTTSVWYNVTSAVSNRPPDKVTTFLVADQGHYRTFDYVTTTIGGDTSYQYQLNTFRESPVIMDDRKWKLVWANHVVHSCLLNLSTVVQFKIDMVSVLVDISWFRCKSLSLFMCKHVVWTQPTSLEFLCLANCELRSPVFHVRNMEFHADVSKEISVSGRIETFTCTTMRQLQLKGNGYIRTFIAKESVSNIIISDMLSIRWWHVFVRKTEVSIQCFQQQQHLTVHIPVDQVVKSEWLVMLQQWFSEVEIVRIIRSYREYQQWKPTRFLSLI